MSKIKDKKLAKKGKSRVDWAYNQMPVLHQIGQEFKKEKPLKKIVIGACLHVTKETGVLMKVLQAGGAEVYLAGSNPLTTQDDVASYLADQGIKVFTWHGQTDKEYYWCLNKVLDSQPQITLDDGADLISLIHSKRKNLLENVLGGQEETTTGVIRLRAMEKDKALKYPVVAVNDTPTKHMFDNVYGTGQSTLDAIVRATNILLAGKTVVVVGYGYCGRGVAQRARGMGSNVIVCEVDPLRALKAVMDGFWVMPMEKASERGDLFITVTGDKDVIRKEHMKKMKDGAILANSGHFNVEINLSDLKTLTIKRKKINDNLEEFVLRNGKKIFVLAEGRLVNLVAGEGHPSSVMDMSFANQALISQWLVKNKSKLEVKVYDVPDKIDKRVARLKLKGLGIKIDSLTKKQKKYLSSWTEGT